MTKKKSRAPAVEIREMELDDLSQVFALGEATFSADSWPSLHRTWDEAELVSMYGSDRETCFVAEADGQVVGFILGTVIAKRKSAWSYGWVIWLAVAPAFRRSGVAHRLLDWVTEAFIDAGARMVLADTDAGNRGAVRFFEGHGFGKERAHVYLSRNLTKDPAYRRRRARKA